MAIRVCTPGRTHGSVQGSRISENSQCSFDERAQRILFKTDFSYFCSICAPYAGAEELRTVCDWGNWVCPVYILLDHALWSVLTVGRQVFPFDDSGSYRLVSQSFHGPG